MMRRRRHHRQSEAAEMNITAFMNLMVVLVPFLLITAVFSRMAVLELNLPTAATPSHEPPQQFTLEVTVREELIEVGERAAGRLKLIPKVNGEYDLAALTDYLKAVKNRFPDKVEATLLLEPDISYDTVVQVMDSMRLVEVVQAAEVIKAELFPEISIGDAPI